MTFSLRIMARELASAIKSCAQVSDTSGKIPILKTTLIDAKSGTASFTATNTDQTITARAACEGDASFCIDTATLAAKISTLRSDQPVSIDGDDKSVTISQGRTKWKMPILPAEDFPNTGTVNGDPVTVTDEFAAAILAVAPVVATAFGLPHAGVLIDGNKIVATDGKQLRLVEITPTFPRSAILPPRACSLIPANCEVRIDEWGASFTTDALTFKTKLISGQFPDYPRVVASFSGELVNSANVDREQFLASLERASAIKASGEKQGTFINMQLRFRDEEIEVFTRNHIEGEEGSDFVACERTGGDSDVGFNGSMIIAAVQSLTSETVTIRYGKASSPVIIEPLNSKGENIRVVMPRAFS